MNSKRLIELAEAVEAEDKKISNDPVWQKFLAAHGELIEPFAKAVVELLNEIYHDASVDFNAADLPPGMANGESL